MNRYCLSDLYFIANHLLVPIKKGRTFKFAAKKVELESGLSTHSNCDLPLSSKGIKRVDQLQWTLSVTRLGD